MTHICSTTKGGLSGVQGQTMLVPEVLSHTRECLAEILRKESYPWLSASRHQLEGDALQFHNYNIFMKVWDFHIVITLHGNPSL